MASERKINVSLAVAATGVMSFAGVLIETATNVTFPSLMKEFDIGTSTVQWVTTIYLLTISIFVPMSTYFIHNFSRRNLFIAGNLFFLGGVLLDFWAPSFSILLLGRFLQGVATGISLPLMFQIILTEAPLSRRGVMMGIGTFTTSIAPAIGPTYGGMLTTYFTWHWIFLLLLPVLILSFILGLIAIPQETKTKSTKLDFAGVIWLALAFSGFLFFFGSIGTLAGWISLVAGFVSMVIFLKTTPKKQHPLLDLRILKVRGFRLLLSGFLIYQIMLLGVSFIVPNFVQVAGGKEASFAGLLMLPGAAVGALFAPFSGRLLDRYGGKKPIMYGALFALFGWACFTVTLGRTPLYMIPVCHILFLIGEGMSYSNMMTTAMNELSKEQENDGNAIFNTLQQFMGAFGTSLVASIIGAVQGKSDLPLAQSTKLGSTLAMAVLLVLMVVNVICCWRYFYGRKKEAVNY